MVGVCVARLVHQERFVSKQVHQLNTTRSPGAPESKKHTCGSTPANSESLNPSHGKQTRIHDVLPPVELRG